VVDIGGGFDAFHALGQEKQKRIIEAALREFAEKGYQRASTNTIAKAAQIGKGMLFYYFGSKEELFDFLCEYTIEFAKTTYLPQLRIDTGDFLERYRGLTAVKRRAVEEYPLAIAFFESFFKEGNGSLFVKYADEMNALREQILGGLYEGLDYSLFRAGLDGKAAVRYMQWLFDAYQRQVEERFRRGELRLSDKAAMVAEWARLDAFCADLRKLFYQEGT
jgi:AcrR family transcriptional regulator